MIIVPNARGFVPDWSHKGATLKQNRYTLMETDDKNLAELKRDYLNLVLIISKLRYKGEEPPFELIIQAQEIGRLALISEHQLNKLLIG